ncbi:MAG: cobalt-zinc-cadmium efflux system membrane fusion protein [Candidatus Azotimanducaceae bacterium]|jgi:cobalt-zinc-cadmium efflux system membrane fusion protein
MRMVMKNVFYTILVAALLVVLAGCDGATSDANGQTTSAEPIEVGPAKGPHGGRLLIDGDFALELAIFETGVPPEFRVWVTKEALRVRPDDVDLKLTLTRLGNQKDEIGFVAQDDFLRGDMVVYEPHSFGVTIEARHLGTTHRWQYDNFEGRTRIESAVAAAFGLETEVAGPATLVEAFKVYGRVVPNAEKMRSLRARFDGVVQSVEVSVGDTVRRGQKLAEVEVNESFKTVSLDSPIAGVVTARTVNPGEQTNGRELFTITDTSNVWADLAVFPSQLDRVKAGFPVVVRLAAGNLQREGVIARLNNKAEANQSVLARVVLDNSDGALVPGMYLTAEIQVAEFMVPLAVKRTGLQSFRDFTVVYALIGEEYEVRMLDLGRQDAQWVEILGGLETSTRYVTTNSYLVKADIEKSGASHDH